MFSSNSFSRASFSVQSFKMAQDDQARSGYWRLFYTQLQEKANQERLKKSVPAPVLKTKKGAFVTVKPKRAKRLKAIVTPAPEVTPPHSTKPLYTPPAHDVRPSLLHDALQITQELRRYVFETPCFAVKSTVIKSTSFLPEDDALLLLLAA